MIPKTCARFDALLPALLEGESSGDERTAAEAHAATCERCGPLLADIKAIVRDAAALPELEPSSDLWPEIASRIEAPVVELESRQAPVVVRRGVPLRMAAAAAAVLVAVTAFATWRLTSDSSTPVAPVERLATQDSQPIITIPDSQPAGSTQVAAAPETTSATPATQRQAVVVPVTRVAASPEATLTGLYDREISSLRRMLETRRAELDTSTVRVLEENLKIIDGAIEQSRQALARDPNSTFLMNHLNEALGRKVELLRTATLLQTRS